jgi:hypothetical protein
MTRNGPELTDVVNTTGKTLDPYTGEVTNKTDPYFKYLKEKGINISKIEHIKQTPEERKENEKLGSQDQDLNWFVNLSHTEKSKYIGRGHLLTDEQFDYLWENGFKSLLEQYAKTGLQLPDYQIDKIATNSDLRSNYVHNRLLANDYKQDMDGKEFELLNQKQKEHVLNKTKDIQRIIRTSKNRDETAKFIIQNKEDLTERNVYDLLNYVKNKNEIAKLLGQENINKLSDTTVFDLLDLAENKYEMAKLIIQYKDLTDQNVRDLLQHEIYRDKIADLIIQYKKDLTGQCVRYLLQYAKNKEEIAELLGQENISKLSDGSVNRLLYYASDKDEMRRILQKYGRIQ